jgi:hypothetical protein
MRSSTTRRFTAATEAGPAASAHGSPWGRHAGGILGSCVGTIVRMLLQGVRIVLFAVLGICAPFVRAALSFLAAGGLLTTALFYFAGPPGHAVSHGILLAFSIGCAVLLVLYELLLRALQP